MDQGRLEKFERDCDAALGWIARFRSDTVTDEDRQAFALWLSRDPAHGRAMDSMQDLWDDMGSLRHLPEHDIPATPRRRAWLGGSLAVAASLLLGLFLWPQVQGPATTESFQTAVGEHRVVELADGSQVNLNTNSLIRVNFAEDHRNIELVRGEAFFNVSPDKARPFHVNSGRTRVTVVGTAFNVQRHDDYRSDITVAEGVVRVSELDAPATRAATTEILRANERVETGRDGFVTTAGIDLQPLLAWQRGELLARNMPLPQLVDELQRYHDQRILIPDSAVAAMTASGVFRLDDPEATLLALERSHGLRVVRLDERTVQLLQAPQ